MEDYMYKNTFESEETHWWFHELRRIIRSSLHDNGYSRYNNSVRILDDGCGTGKNIVLFSSYGRVVGIDMSPLATGYAQKRGIQTLCQGDACMLPFKDKTFDIVNSSDVLYTIPPKKALAYLREARRVLKPGGLLILNTAALGILYSTHDRAVHTRKRYNRPELEKLLRDAGFQSQTLRYWNSALFVPIVLVRLAKKALFSHDEQGRSDLGRGAGITGSIFQGISRADWEIGKAVPWPFGISLFCVARKP